MVASQTTPVLQKQSCNVAFPCIFTGNGDMAAPRWMWPEKMVSGTWEIFPLFSFTDGDRDVDYAPVLKALSFEIQPFSATRIRFENG